MTRGQNGRNADENPRSCRFFLFCRLSRLTGVLGFLIIIMGLSMPELIVLARFVRYQTVMAALLDHAALVEY